MQIELRSVHDIKPYESNPRRNDGAVEAVAKSIREYGWRQPIVVDKDGIIVVGHTRLKAALTLGLEQVPVHVATELTPEQARAYRIADNNLATLSEFDPDLLNAELLALKAVDYDLSLLGWNDADLDVRLAPRGNEGLVDPDDVPAPPDAATTQPGDLIILGNHRLCCGDSGSVADLDRLLDGKPIHLCNSDPPYNVNVEPASGGSDTGGQRPGKRPQRSWRSPEHQAAKGIRPASKVKREKTLAKGRRLMGDFVTDEQFELRLRAWFGNISRVLIPGGGFYLWGGYVNIRNYPPALDDAGLYFSQCLIWHKQHPVITRKDFMGDHEWCQPGDASVLTTDGPVPIQSLRDGDRVVSFKTNDSSLTGRGSGVPVTRAQRWYSGPMLRVAAGPRKTWCTAGHIWSVKLAPEAADLWCVYVMKRGGWWRIGKSKLLSTWGFGVKHRLKTEGGDAAWILSVHQTNLEATIHEQVCQARYGLPTTTWNETYASRRVIDDVAKLYDQLDLDALERGAGQALLDHGRDLKHPFLERSGCRPKIGRRVPLTVRGCNLLPGIMLVPVPDGEQAGPVPWLPISAVDREAFEGEVYSLDVPGTRHYVADGLVTHNCFYGWKEGAAHRFFGPNNVTDVWSVKKVNPSSMIHLTEKPVELAKRAIEYSSQPGENVLDLFGGSGSTLIGCEQTGRRAFLMELDGERA